ncbi:hypothetical protein PR048_033645 [Dryococelus australis]|uniref:Uncharacterized protein n=1 Tax=Dryococelus australis TaxID=614101 RepID=A0ABQ9G0W7_9NEOP|nr:hypothetical protein PR048_033645 [Dryococelus australis]
MECEDEIVDGICGRLSQLSMNVDKAKTETDDTSDKSKDLVEQELLWAKLKLLQCPFSWDDLKEIVNYDKTADKHKARIAQTEKKLETLHRAEFLYTGLILNIVLVYEHFCDGDTGSSLAVLCATEALLKSSSSPGQFSSKLVADNKDALWYVVLACRAYLYFYSRNFCEVGRTLMKIKKFDDLNNACKAGILVVRVEVLIEYGHEGDVASIKHMEAALSLDPNQAEWHFFLGKCLRKLRRLDYSLNRPAKEELKAFEEAYKIAKHPVYAVFLAQAYIETACSVFSKQHNSGTVPSASKVIDRMNKRSVELYK